MAIIGIDLGTTNSLCTVWKNNKSVLVPNALGEVLTPSVVSVDDSGILVGQTARERLISHPGSTAASYKRFMGTRKTYTLAGRDFSPEELSSFVLRRLREDAEAFLGQPVEEAVISVPAYFNDNQRFITKQAGQLAGLRVERLINEPTAAALAARMRTGDEDCKYLVFDFGGGTLDVSVVECFDTVVEILAVSGNNRLGGDDFNRCIRDAFCRENGLKLDALSPEKRAMLLKQAELCKRALSAREHSTMILEEGGKSYDLSLTNETLIQISAPVLTEISSVIQRALTDSATPIRDIDQVVMVGGSCNMPVVRQYLAHLLHKKPVQIGSPDCLVAEGLGAYVGIRERNEEIRDLLLTDICPFTLGTAVHNHTDPNRRLMSPIIERNTTLPASKVETFYTVRDLQTDLKVRVYQGENMYSDDNLLLGTVDITVPPAPAGQESIAVRFTYDINGILEVEVTSVTTGRTERELLLGEGNKLSPQEVERRLAELLRLKIHPREAEENRLEMARAERIYQETTGPLRDQVVDRLMWFQQELARQEPLAARKARERFAAFLDHIETELLAYGFFDGEVDGDW